jgi:hypothetical protein
MEELQHYYSLKKEVLQKYVNHTFFETGTYLCDAVLLAKEVGFKKIISIEIDPQLQLKNLSNLPNDNTCEISLLTGDSLELMPYHVPRITERTTFWLDAHVDFGVEGKKRCPLYEELYAIAHSEIKDHTILIDDIRCFGVGLWGEGISVEGVKEIILGINPNYQFTFEDGYAPQDILVAYIQK